MEARLLATMLEANTEPAVAMFLAIQNSRIQFAVMDAVATVVLSSQPHDDLALFYSIMDYKSSMEKERNALAHGCFGGSSRIKDGVVWVDAVHMAQYGARVGASGSPDDSTRAWLRERTFVYELGDLETVAQDMEKLNELLGWFVGYVQSGLRTPPAPADWRSGRYLELASHPRIAQGMERRRTRSQED